MGTGSLAARLRAAGCVAAEEEAEELIAAAGGDPLALEATVRRRIAGEPLAWVTGSIRFAGVTVRVDPGVYVPRYETAILVTVAAAALPDGGVAVDLCTGSGAVAVALRARRPGARVLATDVDPAACRCARANGVEVHEGDLDAPLPGGFGDATDVVTAVAPYVPTGQMAYLAADFRDHEPRLALDGGPDGLAVLRDVVAAGARLLRSGGSLVVEVGGGQDALLAPVLDRAGFGAAVAHLDEDGDLRVLAAVRR